MCTAPVLSVVAQLSRNSMYQMFIWYSGATSEVLMTFSNLKLSFASQKLREKFFRQAPILGLGMSSKVYPLGGFREKEGNDNEILVVLARLRYDLLLQLAISAINLDYVA